MRAPAELRTARMEFRSEWPLLLAAMAGVGLAAVHGYTVGVFMDPVKKEFGWGAETILLGYLIIGIAMAVGAPFSGRVMDKIGARPMALAGTVVMAAGTMAIGLIPNSILAYLTCFAVVAVGTTMCSAIVWQKVVVERFVAARGLALSIVLCGSNLAGSISPMLATLVIESANWRVSYFVLAGYMFLSAFPLAWFFFRETAPRNGAAIADADRPEPEPAKAGMSTAQACRTREFWLMCISFGFAGAGITGYITHLVPMFTSQGLSLLLAASVVSSLSMFAIGGRLVAGILLDHLFAPRLAAIALALPVFGSLAILFFPPVYWTALFAAILVGLSTGAEFNMISFLTARYFGLRNFGTIGGILYGVFALGCLGGQQLPALLLRWWNYDHVVMLFGASFLIASTAMLFCRRYEKVDVGSDKMLRPRMSD